MTSTAFFAVLAAALLHAAWNAIAHAVTDRLIGFALIGAAGTVAGAATAAYAGVPDPASWPALGLSALLHVGYMGFLMLSYRLGDFGQVYPLARGTSPWLVAIGAAVLVGETLTPAHLAGVLVVSAGLTALVFAGGVPGRAQLPALGAALLTGVMIAGYTVVDGIGVRASGDPLAYLAWLMVLEGPWFLIAAVVLRRGALPAQLRPVWRIGALGGVMSMAAYGLVLWAQTMGDLAAVAALRETSIIFGAVIAAVVFREGMGRVKVVSAAVVAVGIALLNL
ncbi:DMT family transporter [Nocardiopsis sp. RSe5-2]|uniref:DMT family transporter n=1 Tax=Nocardiopsis endophytica TaxID=3018445 RepID=A0ABT4U1G3_9ACTN|nr:DMT family transporter [Nocardiopsis endophytica]MDA2810766.1 DMT family transporter [Nocardiopsis endophytica]